MSVHEVEKVVAVCLLEATKLVLQQLGRYRMDLAERRTEAPESLTTTYGSVRRLRDYFQRSIAAFPERVELELPEGDADLVVSCAARSIEFIDHETSTTRLAVNDARWLSKKREILTEWAVEFATRPLAELPGPKPQATPSPGLANLKGRIHAKLRQDVSAPLSGTAGHAIPTAPEGFHTSFANPFGERQGDGLPGGQHGGAPFESDSTAPIGVGFASMDGDEPTIENRLLDPRAVRDPRLRPLMAMDLRAFERSVEARDYRLATVLLSSIIENATLDYCLLRRSELKLTGAPESWDIRLLIESHLELESAAKDRSVLYQIISAQHLLRPARQLAAPMVVTPASLDRAVGYARRLLKELGFASGSPPAAGPRVATLPQKR